MLVNHKTITARAMVGCCVEVWRNWLFHLIFIRISGDQVLVSMNWLFLLVFIQINSDQEVVSMIFRQIVLKPAFRALYMSTV